MNPSCFAIGNLTANISALSIRKLAPLRLMKRKKLLRLQSVGKQQFSRQSLKLKQYHKQKYSIKVDTNFKNIWSLSTWYQC